MTHLMKFADEPSFSRLLKAEDLFEFYLKHEEGTIFVDPLQTATLQVYDETNNSYCMLFSHFVTPTDDGEWCTISGDWETYISEHNLNAGDEICFYKSKRGDFLLKFEKNEQKEDVHAAVNVKCKRKVGSPVPKEELGFCISKVLSSDETNNLNPLLFLYPQEVISLRRDCPEMVMNNGLNNSKDLIVFDKDRRHYLMCLSRHVTAGSETSYVLRTGWGTFLKTQALKEGDVLVIYRFGKNGYLFRHEGSEKSEESLENWCLENCSCAPRAKDHDEFCFEKVLKSEDLNTGVPILLISDQPVILFEDESKLYDVLAVDEQGELFLFEMTQSVYGPQLKEYAFLGQWDEFVDRHNLNVGDLVIFWKVENKSLSAGFYFHIKVVKSGYFELEPAH